MTEAREWKEELIAEWYELQSYIVLRDVPIHTGFKGGRTDADIVAFKWENNTLKIIDTEVGAAYQKPEETAKKMLGRFTENRKKKILELIAQMIGPEIIKFADYHTIFLDASWQSEEHTTRLRKILAQNNVDVMDFGHHIIKSIPEIIKEWKMNTKTVKGTEPELPDSFKYIKVIEAFIWEFPTQ